jgi:hypothetical protein
VASPIIHRPKILSGHPKINLRLKNINQLTTIKPKRLKPNKLIVAIFLTCIIIVAGATTTYALVNLQSGYVTPKTVLTGAACVKGASTDSIGSHIILISSNLTFNPMLGQISGLQNPNPQIISPSNPAQLNEPSNFNQNQAEYITPQTSQVILGTNLPNQIAVIYALTNENGTTLIIKY